MSWKLMKNVCGFNEMKNCDLLIRQLLSEFLGSLLYLSLVLSAGIGIKSTNDNEGRRIEHGTATVLIAVANGLAVASIITIFGHVSGAHINPAVTCGAMICKHIKPIKAVCYVIMQVVGGIAEFLGSLLYLSLVLSAGIGIKSTNDNEGRRIEHGTATVLIAVANGLAVASIITIFGHVSGAHINPAVTCGAMICKHIKPIKAVCYVIMQVVGGIAGAGVAYLLSSETIRGDLGAIIPYKHLREDQVFGLEFLMTFMVVAVVLSVIDTTRGARGLGSAPLAIGLSMTAGMCCCSPYTASMNPIRSLGPAVIMNRWDSHWVYWAGPMAGGLVAGLTYRCLLLYHRQTIVLQSSRADINRMLDGPRSE